MKGVQFDSEILYVQKLYYFLFLATFSTLTSAIALWRFGLNIGFLVLGVGLVISYIAMLRKKNFTPPKKKVTAQRMARAISTDASPLSIARFACQLYYYFHKPTQAISLLEKFLPSQDPLLCMTLGDILLKEGKARRALYVLRDNPYALIDPLLLTTQGHALKQIEKIPEAVRMYERGLHLAKKNGFPHSGAHWFTQKLLTLSYTASIHHTLADCYVILGNLPDAKRHYRAGNRLLFDLSLWRDQSTPISLAKKHTKSR
ncbi:Tetratricopeptide repeat family protein [Candidatus Desulfosporosinus infrequens]|uniref:Tetratricopeptide repeat family protein n=1 Tax=Candidatus Desulfosporosinus infrequens TaxID=2043169 RepID=A0A2U3LFM0_9FIRM|nr:Tetratricopeptide repeat family protein [Candidatus Desulfosporosinus infrequens]